MPNITLDIYARLHQATLRREELEAQKRFEKLGQQAGQELTKGIEKAAPNIRRAMNSAADAVTAYDSKVKAANKTQQERNALLERAARLEQAHADSYSLTGHLAGEAAKQESEVTEARKALVPVTDAVEARENKLREIRAQHSRTLKEVRLGELAIKQARLDGEITTAIRLDNELMGARRQSALETANIRDKTAELNAIRKEEAARADEVAAKERILSNLRKAHADAIKDLDDIEKQRSSTLNEVSKREAEAARQHDEITSSIRRRDEALRSLAESEVKHERKSSGGGGHRGGGVSTIGSILTDIPFVPGGKAGAAIGTGVVTILASAAEAAVTASQAIALLPAVATAAGAGIATLAIGLNGFGEAVKNLGDPKKFAEALEGMAPAAQQAALEIQYLVQGPLGALKDATQESLFAGVAQQLHTLTDTLLPGVQQLTTSVGTSFNQMFMNATNQLMTPESLFSLNTIINNIVKAFQNLEPAVAPFVSALTKIAETGSSFLPGLATGITNAANSFNNFITQAQKDGSLKEWIQKGIDACQAIISVIGDVGKRIYDTFGNKSPAEFKQTLDTTVEAAFAVANAIVGIAHVVNDLLNVIQPVADSMGGWENLVKVAGAAFLTWKIAGVAKSILDLTGLLKKDLPDAADLGVGKMKGSLDGLIGKFGLVAAAAAAAYQVGQNNPLMNPGSPLPDGTPQVDLSKKKPGDKIGVDANGNIVLVPGGGGTSTSGASPVVPSLADVGRLPRSTIDRLHEDVSGIPLTPQAAGLPGYSPFDVPNVADTESKSKQIAAMRASLNPADFAVDPFAGLPGGNPGMQGAGPIGSDGGGGKSYGPLEVGTNGKPFQKPGLGYQSVNDDSVIRAQNTLIRDGWALTNANLDLEALKKTGLATQQELLDAEHKVQDKWMDIQEHRAALTKAEEGTWNKIASDKSLFSDVLDKDFGISKGLPGIAENLVKYLGSLATAGFRGQLKAIEASDPDWQARLAQKKAGVSGTSVFGQTLPGTDAQTAAGYSPFGGTSMPMPSGVDMPSILSDTGSVASGPQSRQAAAAIQQMFGSQIRGKIGGSRDNNTAKGTHDAGLSIDIPIGPDQGALGDQIRDYLQTNAQALGLKYTIWRDEGRYPDGATGKPAFHTPGHQNHIDAHFNGQGGTGGPLSGGGAAAMATGLSSSALSGAGVTPVYVVNMGGGMGGMGGGGGFPTGTAASGQGIGAPPGPSTGANADTGSFWDAVMPHEGGTWDNQDTGKNGHYGGLQFSPETWKDFGGVDLTGLTNPGMATREQQIEIANRTAWQGYNGKGPQGLSAWEAITKGNVPGITADTPMPTGGLGDPADMFMGGGGEGPIFKKPPGPPGMPGPTPFAPNDVGAGNPARPGMQVVPGVPNPTQYRTANGPIPGPGAASPFANLDPTNPAGTTGKPPGQVGPFPTPAGVNAPPATPFAPAASSKPPAPVGGAPQGGWQPAQTSSSGIGAMAGAAAAMAFPGAGEAAAKAGQLIDRSVKYGGQLAGIGISGLMETFGLSDPDGGGNLQQSWLGRVAGGLAQASPSMPSSAGTNKGAAPGPKEVDPNSKEHGAGGGQAPGPGGINIGTFVQAPNRNSQQVMNDMAFTSAAKGSR
jgi:hypothetical protein